jgi:hypothetical protein
MKKLLLFAGLLACFSVKSQTVLYQDGFETSGTFLLSQTPDNKWVINNNYAGGAIFLGLINIPSVPSQPAGISSANGNYLHPLAFLAESDGVLCSSYYLSGASGSMTAAMTQTVSTLGYENITLKLWRTGGSGGVRILYRVNGGSWTDSGHTFAGNPTGWQEESFTIPAGNDVAQFSVAFEFLENSGLNPAPNHYHSIDEISITGTAIGGGGTNPSLTSSLVGPDNVFCPGDQFSVSYEVTDVTLNTGNQFVIQLSDANGSFAAPTAVGSLTSTNATGTINGAFPLGTAPGTNYAVRVTSSNSAFTGAAAATSIAVGSIPATPTITELGNGDLQSSYSGTNIWYQDGFVISGQSGQTITPLASGTYTVVASNDTCTSATSAPYVYNLSNVSVLQKQQINIYPNPVRNKLNISGDLNEIRTLVIQDALGRSVWSGNPVASIDLSALKSGVYFLHMTMKSGNKETIRIVKQQ